MDAQTLQAMTEALDDEYKARATYAAIIDRFGPVRPFTNIIRAEERHASALERLFVKYNQPVPADRWAGQVQAPDSLEEACAAGVAAEIENRAMYDRLMLMTRRSDILQVFGNLRRASQDNHLPAFQRALERFHPSSQADRAQSGISSDYSALRGTMRRHGQQGNRSRTIADTEQMSRAGHVPTSALAGRCGSGRHGSGRQAGCGRRHGQECQDSE